MSSASIAILVSSDLFLTSQLQGAVQRAGLTCRVCAGSSQLEAAFELGVPDWVIVDVETPRLDLPAVRTLAAPPTQLIAYGPHMRVDLLQSAEQAGFDLVLTRGQVTSQLERILRGENN